MGPLRRTLIAHPALVAVLLAATLLLKLLVPAGFMADVSNGHITIELCSGYGPQRMEMAMPGMDHSMPDHGKKDHGKPEMPCAFSGLSAASLAATDPIQLAALIVFILAIGMLPIVLPAPTRRAYLRPPLRGPPTYL